MSWPDYKGKTVGFAKVMGEHPVSDGTLAYEILNFTMNEEGFLENKFSLMPLIPNEWNTIGKEGDVTTQPVELNKVLAMRHVLWDGESHELLFLTTSGVFLFMPSNRTGYQPYGGSFYGDSSSNGIVEQFLYTETGGKVSIKPQERTMFPPQIENIGNRAYFTYCDGGGAYVWNGENIRGFGYHSSPSAPTVLGPASGGSTNNINTHGFYDSGRIGTLNYDLSRYDDDIELVVKTGGIESGLWYYAVVYENEDGAYSITSEKSSRVTIDFKTADPQGADVKNGLQAMRRRFWVQDLPKGPPGTVARIILRTMNLHSLPKGEVGRLRFLTRIPNNIASEYIDDIPDSELGPVWENRRSVPSGFYFMRFFSGSMFLLRTEDHSSRVYWSEQDTTTGSIPESFINTHWRDVFPETGPITGSYSTNINGAQALLIFKDGATHYLAGSYPSPGTAGWTVGTVSTIAGSAGPNLCQSSPDGSIIWYGQGTFWAIDTSKGGAGVVDIGKSIRKRLSRVNSDRERFGVSWVDKKNKELVFVLPYEDSSTPNMQFVWDYQNNGWRLRNDISINAVETIGDLQLLAGSWSGRVGSKGQRKDEGAIGSPTNTVYVYHRGYSGYAPGDDLRCTYTTGWMSFSEFGPGFHGTQRAAEAIFLLEERSARVATLSTYSDWDFDTPISDDIDVSLTHPENNLIPVYDGVSSIIPTTINSTFANYSSGDTLYRLSRTYNHRVAVDIPSCTVFSLSLSCSSIDDPLSIISIDAFGPILSMPGSRSPTFPDNF